MLTLVVWLVADCEARPYQPTQRQKRANTLQIPRKRQLIIPRVVCWRFYPKKLIK